MGNLESDLFIFLDLNKPGPANYIIPSTLFSGPQYSLTARNIPFQISLEDESYIPTPGPASYDPKNTLLFPKAPEVTLGSRNKPEKSKILEINFDKDLKEFVPGPGAYDPKDRQIKGNQNPKVTLKGRHQMKLDPTPGPGYYDSHKSEENLKPSHVVRLDTKEKSKLFQILKIVVRYKSMIELSPGPSDYSVKSLSVIKPSGPAYSLRKRVEYDFRKIDFILSFFIEEKTPAPTAYKAKDVMNSSKITMKSRASPFVLVFPAERVNTLRV
jgi:hypothetical protein